MNNQPVQFKTLRVKNIGPTATSTDIENALDFNRTPFLQKHTVVEITGEGELRSAKVVSPAHVHVELLKLDGIVMFERKLAFEEEANDAGTEYGDTTADDEEIEYLFIDCRLPIWNFNPVKEVEICAALQIDHAEDYTKAVITHRNRNLGTFAVETTDTRRYINKHLVIRGKEVPIIPIYKRRRQQQWQQQQHDGRRNNRQKFFDPDGLKIRIFDAWKIQHRSTTHQKFDEHFREIGVEVIKPTQPERCREFREVFNSNRYIVVKKTNDEGVEVDFGNRITVDGVSFKLSYFGMKRYCGLCDTKHGFECPTQIQNDLMRAHRKGKTSQCKIYSDSTLRHVNQLSLTSDTACMTGGGIAQLCNAIPYDQPHDEVIINAGTNELNVESLKEFVFTVQQTKPKLEMLATSVPVTVVLPAVPTQIPEQIVKGTFLTKTISEIESIKVITLKSVEMADFRHPTRKGTIDVLNQINEQKPVIIHEFCEATTLPSKYSGVQTLFKVGCRGCDSIDFTHSLCDSCRTTAAELNTYELEKEISDLRDAMYPPLNDVEMGSTSNKRERGSSDDDNADNAKAHRGNHD